MELNSPILALNAAENHTHVAVSISTNVSVAQWAKQVKGASAYEINTKFPMHHVPFRWQESYGVLTFGAKELPFVADYIQRQKEHHREGTTIEYLERTERIRE